jgi:ABC-type cobalamin/Fe3+-siderophores transport system ATPase subunit/SAM-dependent methyltransferase
MKIESVKITPTEAEQLGLNEMTLSRLGKIVLLAGKNGSGKTRIIDYITSLLYQKLKITNKDILESEITQFEGYIQNAQRTIASYQDNLQAGEQNAQHSEYQIRTKKEEIKHHTNQINIRKDQLLAHSKISVVGQGNFVNYVPKVLNLKDSNDLTFNELENAANSVKESGVNNLHQGALAAIQLLQTTWHNATHQDSKLDDNEKSKIIQQYEKLQGYIRKFMNTKLGRDPKGNTTIYGKPIGKANLSDGQKVFIQFCVALHAQEGDLADFVLFMDEPENHLHPAALIEVLEKLNEVVSNGQIWIATHSINILAHFSEGTVYYVEEGNATYAGNGPEKVLNGLLGDEEEIAKLSSFLDLPFAFSSAKFSYESLVDAPVVMTGSDDPQIKQIKDALSELRTSGNTIQLLDYGAGKGRLIATIQEKEKPDSGNLEEWLDYVAFDIDRTNATECIRNISSAYREPNKRYYNDEQKLIIDKGEKSFDVIVLTNVFHEISPDYWLEVLRGIKKLLKESGILLIIEDQRLPHGEKPNSYGFLVFDTQEFRKLFAVDMKEQGPNGLYYFKEERNGRLKAHYIKGSLIDRVNNITRESALKELFDHSQKEISRIRSSGQVDFKAGKEHAFWITQLANAQLALNKLGG